MKTLKVFAFSLLIFIATFFSFFTQQARSNVLSEQQNVNCANDTLCYEVIEGILCLVTYDTDGKIVDVLVVD